MEMDVLENIPDAQNTEVAVDHLHHPHDVFFKAMMGDPRIAREFVEMYLPPELLARTELQTLTVCKGSFVDEQLKKSETDILLSVMIDESLAYFYVLAELQNTVDRDMPYRILRYKMRILAQHRRKYPNESLPVIYAIVLYNGDRPYTASRDLFDLFEPAKVLAQETFFAPFQLIDLNHVEDDLLREKQWAGAMAFMLKYARARDFIDRLYSMIDVLRLLEQEGDDTIRGALVHYALSQCSDHERFVRFTQTHILVRLEESAMNALEQSRHQGIAQGLSQGIIQGRQEGFEAAQCLIVKQMYHKVQDPCAIAELTGLPLETVCILLDLLK